MFAIKFLSGVLTKKPRTTQGPGVAAVPFTLPAWTGTAVTWPDLEAALTASTAEATAILAAGETMTDEQKRVLGHIMTSDERKLAEVQARKSNSTVRRKPDRARETLDWAAGASDPPASR